MASVICNYPVSMWKASITV